jgi:hypothetical protein
MFGGNAEPHTTPDIEQHPADAPPSPRSPAAVKCPGRVVEPTDPRVVLLAGMLAG